MKPLIELLPDALLIANLARIRSHERALRHATETERAEWTPRIIDPVVEQIHIATGVPMPTEEATAD